jgi:hypothetical protein
VRKPGSEGQKHILPHMWKLDLKVKCTRKNIYDHIHDIKCIYLLYNIYVT